LDVGYGVDPYAATVTFRITYEGGESGMLKAGDEWLMTEPKTTRSQ
jgi:hypothetical protein